MTDRRAPLACAACTHPTHAGGALVTYLYRRNGSLTYARVHGACALRFALQLAALFGRGRVVGRRANDAGAKYTATPV